MRKYLCAIISVAIIFIPNFLYSTDKGDAFGVILRKVSNSNKVVLKVIKGSFTQNQNIIFYSRYGRYIGAGTVSSIYSDSIYAESPGEDIYGLLHIGDIVTSSNNGDKIININKEEFAIPIYINNHSFEYDTPYSNEDKLDRQNRQKAKSKDKSKSPIKSPDGVPWKSGGEGEWHDQLLTGWTTTGVSGTFRPTPEIIYDEIPDGYNIAFSNNGSISQIPDHNLMKGFIYRLKVYVGQRRDHKFGRYNVQLRCRNIVLAESNYPVPKSGEFYISIVTYKVLEGDKNVGKPIEIKLITTGGQVNYDNISLEAFEYE
jgi:hypothetical protein